MRVKGGIRPKEKRTENEEDGRKEWEEKSSRTMKRENWEKGIGKRYQGERGGKNRMRRR